MNPIVFYDGECNFCHYWVQWTADRDPTQIFRFAPLQSEFAKELFSHFNQKRTLDTIYIYTEEGEFLTRSKAVSYIFNRLNVRTFFSSALKLFPRFVADIGYNITASFRKRFKNSCRMFSAEEKKLFLGERNFSEWLQENR